MLVFNKSASSLQRDRDERFSLPPVPEGFGLASWKDFVMMVSQNLAGEVKWRDDFPNASLREDFFMDDIILESLQSDVEALFGNNFCEADWDTVETLGDLCELIRQKKLLK